MVASSPFPPLPCITCEFYHHCRYTRKNVSPKTFTVKTLSPLSPPLSHHHNHQNATPKHYYKTSPPTPNFTPPSLECHRRTSPPPPSSFATTKHCCRHRHNLFFLPRRPLLHHFRSVPTAAAKHRPYHRTTSPLPLNVVAAENHQNFNTATARLTMRARTKTALNLMPCSK